MPDIFAIGDVIGQPMLAHKAVHEAHCAAEVISGEKHTFEPRCIPSVAYTDPEMAWTGVTETEAKEQGLTLKLLTSLGMLLVVLLLLRVLKAKLS